jgi:hypothetical protein
MLKMVQTLKIELKKPAAQIAHLFFSNAKANATKNKRAILANARPNQRNE